jgi:hypothetical protein
MKLLATGAVLASLVTGCANVSTCRGLTIGTGALLGATAGGLISSIGSENADHNSDADKNWIIAGSTGGGALAGSLIGWGLSHAFCREEAPPPPAYTPPPPPPPPPAEKLPPPPPTERRGG